MVDAIAGGGGLLSLPMLLAVGLPPHLALGTNKGQSVFGSFAALVRYSKAGLVDRRRAVGTFPAGLLGAFVGATALLQVDRSVLRPVVLVLLVSAGGVVALRPPAAAELPQRRVRHAALLATVIALALGVYDGFFGPGTGTFLILAFMGVLGATLPRATADAKVVNFASNLASVAIFASRGVVLWALALPMAVAQLLGGFLGAHLAVRGGHALIRRVVLGVVICLALKLGVDLLWSRLGGVA